MKNDYEVRGNIVSILLRSSKYGEKEVIFDLCDLQKVIEFPNTWGLHWDPTIRDFYCRGKMKLPGDNSRSTIYLHRWITGCPSGLQVDHIDNNPLNNRRANLRIVSCAENQQNVKGAQRNSRTGIRGVYWVKKERKWCARIEVYGKKIHLGLYKKINDAAEVVTKARAELMPYSKEAARALKRKKA